MYGMPVLQEQKPVMSMDVMYIVIPNQVGNDKN
jgi:hypothetical protein